MDAKMFTRQRRLTRDEVLADSSRSLLAVTAAELLLAAFTRAKGSVDKVEPRDVSAAAEIARVAFIATDTED